MRLTAPTLRDFIAAVLLGVVCSCVYLLMVLLVGPLLGEPKNSVEIGGMWAVLATIFVYRASVREGSKSAWTRLAATALSFAICFVYLLIFPVVPVGIGAVVAIGTLIAVVIGRPEDAALTGITSVVVLVVADLASPAPGWIQPLLRLFDTAVGIGAGLAAAMLLSFVTTALKGRRP
ncbi:hypothetical protein ASF06_18180 [Agreia sp. Leaf244]|uniref:FUSC family protein n=1 Tax=Agreia sp. Leaf244 TaxID=1736305 RepID=UPI0006F37FE7|nr:FUSC family protein [Agreia sp. Leaf244]KQO05419.1 hypothetical protein ASF06_18180 [Agreia sp. Leaf244]